MRSKKLLALIVLASLLISGLFYVVTAQAGTEAVVIVNSASASYADFQRYIQPYLDNFGVPYTVLDIATTSINVDIAEHAVIIIGHRKLDPDDLYLNAIEESYISEAVNAGTGLVNFDNDLSVTGSVPRYQFIDNIFGFSYTSPTAGSGVNFVPLGSGVIHYITERHQAGESISTGSMTMAGISLPGYVTALANSGNKPFLAVTTSGQGHAVQWGTYDWMSYSVKGPVYGLDDLVWRSIVWAARKPFVMQSLPPFVTMRCDDESGSFWWMDIANEFGIKPWIGLFMQDYQPEEAAHLSSLVHSGMATASIHAFTSYDYFYYDHGRGVNSPDDVMAANYAAGTLWHSDYNIPISKFVLPHYYEIGTNAFGGLKNWGVEFIGIPMDPGKPYGSSWIVGGPYRLYESPDSSSLAVPFYYADFITVPGHPEFDGQFFNCITEIRDASGSEWAPDNDVSGSIGRGTGQAKRALDSMVLATLFTHSYFINAISPNNWYAILQGVTNNLAPYHPLYVTMDYACQYARALYTSYITASTFNPDSGLLTTTLGGYTDIPTMFYLFTENDGSIQQTMVDVPTFSGSTEVIYQLTGPLARIVITPNSANVAPGAAQQFTATGYAANYNPIPNLTFTWSTTSGGTIDQNGLFTAGFTPGVYINSIVASRNGISGYASVEVYQPSLDHFVFDPIPGTVTAGVPFGVRITAYDQYGNVLSSYAGQAALSDTTGTITPTMTGNFVNGVWSGNVTIGQAASDVKITVRSGSATGISNSFAVQAAALNIITTSLPDGVQGMAYTATLTASGGNTPYTWSIASGSLPAGLSLNSGTGVISGTPTAAGTFSFTARVTDAGSQSVIKALSITISSSTNYTIWSSTTTPAVIGNNDPNAVELGVKFRSSVNGYITGLRFYKSSANTGTHIGNLWTSTGTKLATATFTNETGSGWQQVNFTTPVAISANTTYVASYYTSAGYYSINQSYFASSGVTNGPLQALANGVDGGNGVYKYGTSGFPNQTWNASNYWVDVVFSPGAPPTLSSIAVTPVNPTIITGTTQQFTATGTYSDGSTQNLTSQVTWTSSNTSVAAINSAGLATAGIAGSTTISATLSSVTGSTTLIVQLAPLSITTTSLPDGVQGMAYTATLTASGGNTPYTWSIASGSLPAGLSLNSGTGVISGTPTAAGTFSFTARVTDAGSQSVTKALSITVSAQTPVEVKINCGEDANQMPVLLTTTNASDLSTTDGKWTEFQYASRPYAAVFAGAHEADFGLPVMRFYTTGIQNGTYDIIANLYSWGAGRTMRYYFGYQSSSPKANYVDVVGNSSDPYQFKEYNVGSITVTDGTFNIYVVDADLLAGSYPYFGWAWIRLVPLQ